MFKFLAKIIDKLFWLIDIYQHWTTSIFFIRCFSVLGFKSVCLYVYNTLAPLLSAPLPPTPYWLFRLISSLNSVKYEIGFRLEGFFFIVFFFKIIHLLPKINRLHVRSYGRWSSLFIRCFSVSGGSGKLLNHRKLVRPPINHFFVCLP